MIEPLRQQVQMKHDNVCRLPCVHTTSKRGRACTDRALGERCVPGRKKKEKPLSIHLVQTEMQREKEKERKGKPVIRGRRR